MTLMTTIGKRHRHPRKPTTEIGRPTARHLVPNPHRSKYRTTTPKNPATIGNGSATSRKSCQPSGIKYALRKQNPGQPHKDKMKKPLLVNNQNWKRRVLGSDQPVAVNFCATWCGPCKTFRPTVGALAEQYGDRLTVAVPGRGPKPRDRPALRSTLHPHHAAVPQRRPSRRDGGRPTQGPGHLKGGTLPQEATPADHAA